MERCNVLICLGLITMASTVAEMNPRGTRPVEPGTRSEKCDTQKEWPFCTDDQWGPKCPSGCRIQGLMDKHEHDALKQIEKIRSLLDQNKAKHRSADQVTKQTFDYLKEKLTTDAGSDKNYYDLAQNLRQRITDMKIKIDRQVRHLAALKDRVKEQVIEMQRLEVDIDIKLRSCKGSCESYTEHQVDQESYVALDKQVNQLDSQSVQNIEAVGTLNVMKSRLLRDSTVDPNYKAKAGAKAGAGQQQDMFEEVQNVHLILEEEGSKSSPATISKVAVCTRLKQQNQEGRQPSSHAQAYRQQYCPVTSDVALCSDDDWVSKCPSGCRLQGLISQMEHQVESKLRTVCKTANMYEDAAEKSMMAMTRIYNYNRRVIISGHKTELKFIEDAEGLARNLTLLRKRSSLRFMQLEELHGNVQKQIADLYRTEVDIDMKLRACYGSCQLALPFSVDHLGYQGLQADMEQINKKAATPPTDIPHVKLQPVDPDPAPAAGYKTIPAVQRELLTQFEDIGQNRVVLEELDLADLE